MLLAIDTSAGTDVAVVTEAGRLRGHYRLDDARRHAEAVGIGISRVLDEAGIRPQHVTGVICGMGPGPFTGLRVGVAAARTFAFVHGVPLHPVPSHDAIAHEWRHDHPDHRGPILVTTDARRREFAASRYEQGEVTSSEGFTLLTPAEAEAVTITRADASQVSAWHLALAWLDRRQGGLPEAADEILYLRAPDAKPGAVPKRVTG
ncbi:tRNA (adenosine(37)-N6)-threonylcarbamoyltransferase complex dimerization subunit type 1 TsaB [Gulosibacter macacae]|uniref:tRNA (Adenosine(37)-N6)-threonylcarbamoyltransferase complex dimerization subunit type 1 TsaB n=1 Tax=Gulosibacter macacae TaxID=2488791 RepID=A0A3P3VXS1_9MICO|nr:tRNA (adenosine(37)-N6)-threonylcarbamoyltransferase complex dimerization subunit type 1 TsaB [Gulosibacter macacae]RRJ87592.1 tRNA (adenosine(37)-N6)-threonylcarbamoyltransferase complex dimerization subunit type 1 TsaB [Gulosibacter macacae]